MRSIHRIVAFFAMLFTLYLGVTGSLLQLTDLAALLSHAPANSPTIEAIHEGTNGPGNFVVISPSDYTAPSLPAGFDYDGALAAVVAAARAAAADAPISYIELRVEDSVPVGRVKAGKRIIWFSALTGAAARAPAVPPNGEPRSPPALRAELKSFHRLQWFGDKNLWINASIGVALFGQICTGLILYFKLLRDRARLERSGLFWLAGGWWRSIHRGVAIVASVFLMVVAITGVWLSIDSLCLGLYNAKLAATPGSGGPFAGIRADVSAPLSDAELPSMMHTTLAAYQRLVPGASVKILRLRYFAGMPQGVIVGGGEDTDQFVFNASTGSRASEYEADYPLTGFPLGWQIHETIKKITEGIILVSPAAGWICLPDSRWRFSPCPE